MISSKCIYVAVAFDLLPWQEIVYVLPGKPSKNWYDL